MYLVIVNHTLIMFHHIFTHIHLIFSWISYVFRPAGSSNHPGHPCEEPTEDIHHQRQGGSQKARSHRETPQGPRARAGIWIGVKGIAFDSGLLEFEFGIIIVICI